MKTIQFSGVYTALATPFDAGRVSFDDFEKLIAFQIDNGINGIVPVGTTGESPTLSHDEHAEVIQCAVATAAGRVPVIAGTGSNSTTEAVSLTRRAHDAGVDGMLQVAPYYNKPSQEGIFEHFNAVAEATDRPIVLYSIPGRCGVEIGIPTVERLLSKHPHVNVIKEAGGNCDRVAELHLAMGDDLVILSGDDSMTLPFMANGASGVISVASNLVVSDLVAMVGAALKNDYTAARIYQLKYFQFFRALFMEPNPVHIKAALCRAGIIHSGEVRLPLSELSVGTRQVLFGEMDRLGI